MRKLGHYFLIIMFAVGVIVIVFVVFYHFSFPVVWGVDCASCSNLNVSGCNSDNDCASGQLCKPSVYTGSASCPNAIAVCSCVTPTPAQQAGSNPTNTPTPTPNSPPPPTPTDTPAPPPPPPPTDTPAPTPTPGPSKPTITNIWVTVRPNTGSVNCTKDTRPTWHWTTNDGGGTISEYRINRNWGNVNPVSCANNTYDRTCTMSDAGGSFTPRNPIIKAGFYGTRRVQVKGVNEAGEGGYSAWGYVNIDLEAPNPPFKPTGFYNPTTDSIEFSWPASTDKGCGKAGGGYANKYWLNIDWQNAGGAWLLNDWYEPANKANPSYPPISCAGHYGDKVWFDVRSAMDRIGNHTGDGGQWANYVEVACPTPTPTPTPTPRPMTINSLTVSVSPGTPSCTNDGTPTWRWIYTDPDNQLIRFDINRNDVTGTVDAATTQPEYTPPADMVEIGKTGQRAIRVQAVGSWSNSGWYPSSGWNPVVTIDRAAPDAPNQPYGSYNPTTDSIEFSWPASTDKGCGKAGGGYANKYWLNIDWQNAGGAWLLNDWYEPANKANPSYPPISCAGHYGDKVWFDVRSAMDRIGNHTGDGGQWANYVEVACPTPTSPPTPLPDLIVSKGLMCYDSDHLYAKLFTQVKNVGNATSKATQLFIMDDSLPQGFSVDRFEVPALEAGNESGVLTKEIRANNPTEFGIIMNEYDYMQVDYDVNDPNQVVESNEDNNTLYIEQIPWDVSRCGVMISPTPTNTPPPTPTPVPGECVVSNHTPVSGCFRTNPVLSVSVDVNADQIQFAVDNALIDANNKENPFDDNWTCNSGWQGSSSYTCNLSTGTYYWSARAKSSTGACNQSGLIPQYSFGIDKTAPYVPNSLKNPSYNPDTKTITFSWDPSTDLGCGNVSGYAKYYWLQGWWTKPDGTVLVPWETTGGINNGSWQPANITSPTYTKSCSGHEGDTFTLAVIQSKDNLGNTSTRVETNRKSYTCPAEGTTITPTPTFLTPSPTLTPTMGPTTPSPTPSSVRVTINFFYDKNGNGVKDEEDKDVKTETPGVGFLNFKDFAPVVPSASVNVAIRDSEDTTTRDICSYLHSRLGRGCTDQEQEEYHKSRLQLILPRKQYSLTLEAPEGFVFTKGGGVESNCQVDNLSTYTIIFGEGESEINEDVGFVKVGTLVAKFWIDTNKNGNKDADEDWLDDKESGVGVNISYTGVGGCRGNKTVNLINNIKGGADPVQITNIPEVYHPDINNQNNGNEFSFAIVGKNYAPVSYRLEDRAHPVLHSCQEEECREFRRQGKIKIRLGSPDSVEVGVGSDAEPWIQIKNGDVSVGGSVNIQIPADQVMMANDILANLHGILTAGSINSPADPNLISTTASYYKDGYSPWMTAFDKVTQKLQAQEIADLSGLSSLGSGIYKVVGDASVENLIDLSGDNKAMVIIVDGNLSINKNITTDNSSHLSFIVSRDVNIDHEVSQVDAIIVFSGTLYTDKNDPESDPTIDNPDSGVDAQLIIKGALIGLNESSSFKLERSLSRSDNVTTPATVIIYQPKDIYWLQQLLAQPAIYQQERSPIKN